MAMLSGHVAAIIDDVVNIDLISRWPMSFWISKAAASAMAGADFLLFGTQRRATRAAPRHDRQLRQRLPPPQQTIGALFDVARPAAATPRESNAVASTMATSTFDVSRFSSMLLLLLLLLQNGPAVVLRPPTTKR